MKNFMGNINTVIKSKLFEDLISFILLIGIIGCLFGFPTLV